ncbi:MULTISPECIES: helix-turn-helix domain-containing protein [Methylobacterium]|uniref:helix-turn-helix domain-containing protein n=1 Tax=Methylobacterium TaxID=407 RepID=UPI001F251261|nr:MULTISPECIES: helix-turn-helix domain-containing protein [Methylobacterium]MCF4124955.1 helix-turn-helix domain-containing protein [Methylobacterium sp. SyP6R]
MNNTEQYGAMSIEDFCRWAGIGRSLAYKEIEAGRLRIKKVGRRTLITMDAARAWLANLPDGDAGNAA